VLNVPGAVDVPPGWGDPTPLIAWTDATGAFALAFVGVEVADLAGVCRRILDGACDRRRGDAQETEVDAIGRVT
jgi:hypothetical protein